MRAAGNNGVHVVNDNMGKEIAANCSMTDDGYVAESDAISTVVKQPKFTRVGKPTLLWCCNASCHSKGESCPRQNQKRI